jgi:hypothetical protein
MIGAAPLNPTQEINTLDLFAIPLKGKRHKNTDNGRPTKITKTPTIKAGSAILNISFGLTSIPKTKNITICTIHTIPSKNELMLLFSASLAFPITIPATYTAR